MMKREPKQTTFPKSIVAFQMKTINRRGWKVKRNASKEYPRNMDTRTRKRNCSHNVFKYDKGIVQSRTNYSKNCKI